MVLWKWRTPHVIVLQPIESSWKASNLQIFQGSDSFNSWSKCKQRKELIFALTIRSWGNSNDKLACQFPRESLFFFVSKILTEAFWSKGFCDLWHLCFANQNRSNNKDLNCQYLLVCWNCDDIPPQVDDNPLSHQQDMLIFLSKDSISFPRVFPARNSYNQIVSFLY